MARIGWGDPKASYRLTVASRRDSGYANQADDKQVEQGHFRADWSLSSSDDLMFSFGHARYSWGLQDPSVASPREENWRNTYLNTQWTRRLNPTDAISLSVNFDTERYLNFFPLLKADGISRRYELEAQHTFSLGQRLRIVWGGQYRHEQVVSPELFYSHPDQRFSVRRGFGNIEWTPHPQWVVNAGGLIEDHSIVGTSRAPRLMVNFHASPGQTLRAGTTYAFKQPSLFQLRADWRLNGVPQVLATGRARPERVEATEFGYLGEFSSLRLSVDVRAFREHVTELLRYSGSPTDLVNKDPNTQRGWETQWRWRPRSGTELQINYTQLRLVTDATSTATQDRYRAPSNITSLTWFQELPYNFDLALIHYMVDQRFIIRTSDSIPDFQQTDLRLARRFQIGSTRAEAALMFRAIGGGDVDYVERNWQPFHIDRRMHATLRLEF